MMMSARWYRGAWRVIRPHAAQARGTCCYMCAACAIGERFLSNHDEMVISKLPDTCTASKIIAAKKTKAQTMTGGGEALNRAGRCQLQYTTRLVAATL